eukprot:3665955-Prymnesium_polylepis.1
MSDRRTAVTLSIRCRIPAECSMGSDFGPTWDGSKSGKGQRLSRRRSLMAGMKRPRQTEPSTFTMETGRASGSGRYRHPGRHRKKTM